MSTKPKMLLKGHESNEVNYLDFIKVTEETKSTILSSEQQVKKEIPSSKEYKPQPIVTSSNSGATNSISPLLKKNTLTDISNAPTITTTQPQTGGSNITQAGSFNSFKSNTEHSKKKNTDTLDKSKFFFLIFSLFYL